MNTRVKQMQCSFPRSEKNHPFHMTDCVQANLKMLGGSQQDGQAGKGASLGSSCSEERTDSHKQPSLSELQWNTAPESLICIFELKGKQTLTVVLSRQ